MPNKPVPDIVDQLLSLERVRFPRMETRLSAQDFAQAQKRLIWLCSEMAARIVNEPDDTRFADIDGLVKESVEVAHRLGFTYPPVQQTVYQRGKDRSGENLVGATISPIEASTLELKGYRYAFGYQFNAPENSAAPVMFTVATMDGNSRDPLQNKPKTREKMLAEEALQRWVRWLQAMETPNQALSEKMKESLTSGVVQRQAAEPETAQSSGLVSIADAMQICANEDLRVPAKSEWSKHAQLPPTAPEHLPTTKIGRNRMLTMAEARKFCRLQAARVSAAKFL